ncbi:reticulon-like protein B9 [Dioscorea cayenensis subsp. rotundata]|uniref:Reticulon-like protein n=1 Tax=Dioscorea cayennensis subsp. rotundata TaxID=55577 RepID=A0AB40BCF2_DIOCR|nr:reticulon-like protein B9 [Dioscorea cayenensis subsp. rotundata]
MPLLEQYPSQTKLFGRERPLHELFGGGRVADLVLWRNKQLSGGVLAIATLIWFLFEVMEYNFITLMCHIAIAVMLFIFIWANAAALLEKPPPQLPDIILSEQGFKKVSLVFQEELNLFLSFLHEIAIGKNLKLFLLTIAGLWIVSVMGNYFNPLSFLYFGYLCIQTLPVMYEQYENDVDSLAYQVVHDAKKLFMRFNENVLNKIPRGPVKEKKFN